MQKFNPKNLLKYLIICFTIFSLTGCSGMTIKINAEPKNDEINNPIQQRILVLIIQGQTSQEFSAVTPYDLGKYVIKHPEDFTTLDIDPEGNDYEITKDIDPDKTISIYIVGNDINYNLGSHWKYFFNKLDKSTLNLNISPNGKISKEKDNWL